MLYVRVANRLGCIEYSVQGFRTGSLRRGRRLSERRFPPRSRCVADKPPSVTTLRFVGSRDGAEADYESVPAVAGDNSDRQRDEFVLREVFADVLVEIVGDLRVGDANQRLRPGQRRALVFGVERLSCQTFSAY